MRDLYRPLSTLVTLALAIGLGITSSTRADNGVRPLGAQFDPPSTCTTANCQSLEVRGHINAITTGGISFGLGPVPWVDQFLAGGNECLRFDVSSQSQDLRMVVIGPGGVVYGNDDKGTGACTLCPLIKIKGTIAGHYTLHVSQWIGLPVSASFRLHVGRYNKSNPNCASASPPLSTRAVTAKRADGPNAHGRRRPER